MFKSEYDQIIRENFDLSDRYTRQYIANLEDGGQEQLLAALSSALYDKIVAKVDEIDFGTIPQSRGDITKVQGFEKTEQCMDIIRKLVIEYKQKTDIIDTVITATSNIKDRKSTFTKAFAINAELPILVYNLMALSIERSVSLIIATCIQFVKDPTSSTPKSALDKVAYERTMDDMLFKQLASFNNMCKNKSIDKVLDSSMKGNVRESIAIFDIDSICADCPTGIDPFGDIEITHTSSISKNDNEEDGFDPCANVDNKSECPAEPAHAEEPSHEEEHHEEEPSTGEFSEEVPNTEVPDVEDIIKGNENNDHGESKENDPPVARAIFGMIKKSEEPNEEEHHEEEKPIIAGSVLDIIKKSNEEPEVKNDDVEPENIPTVVPGDDTMSSDTAINELEKQNCDCDLEEANLPNFADAIGKAAKSMADKVRSNPNSKKILAVTAITAALVAAPILIVKVLIPGVRYLVYLFYYTTMKVSDYLDIQAALIEANANELENSTDSESKDTKKTIEKQRKWADRLRKWSNIFAVDQKTASNKAKSESSKDDKQKKTVQKDEEGDDSIF